MKQRLKQQKKRNKPEPSQRTGPVQSLPKAGFLQPQQGFRTGRPLVRSVQDRIIVTNTEIAIEVNGTVASGVIPAGGAIRVFKFDTATTGNNMNSTRWLTKIAQAYDKFRIRKMNMRWVTSLPVTYAGQVALRWDADPSKTTADAGLLAVSGDMRALACAVYNNSTNRVMADQMNRLPQYDTFNIDTGVSSVGSINLAYSTITPPQGVSGTINLGYVWIDYEVEFFNPSAVVNA